MPLNSAVVRYVRKEGNSSVKDEVILFRILDTHLGELELHQIESDIIQTIINGRVADGVSNPTINKSLE